AFGDAPRDELHQALSKFVTDTVARLESRGVADTSLARIWRELQALSDDERKFCELVGSLGVAPGDASDELADALDRLYDAFGERAVRDLCFAANETQVRNSIAHVGQLTKLIDQSKSLELSPLLAASLPKENFYGPSWRRGLQSAKNVRDSLNISLKDPSGADKLFE